MSRPPESKQNPLADQRHFGCGLSPKTEIDETRLLFGGAADSVNERQVCVQEGGSARDFRFGLMLRRERQSSGFERLRVHVIGGGVDEIAPENDAARDPLHAGGIDAIGNAKPRGIAVIGLVAVETIAGQNP